MKAMETRFLNIYNTLNATSNVLNSELSQVSSNQQSIVKQQNSLRLTQGTHTSQLNDVNSVLKILRENVTDVSASSKDIERKIQATQETIKNTQSSVKLVYFHSRLMNDYTMTNGPIPFETVYQEAGSGYDKNTGIFKAPYKGLYHFSFVLTRDSSKMAQAHLKHNNDDLCYVMDEDKNGADYESMLGCSANIILNAGETVYVYGTSGQNLNDGTGGSSFTGVLIHEI